MNSGTYLIWIVVIILLIQAARLRKITAVAHILHKKRGTHKMMEFISEFVEKEVIIYTVDGKTVEGTLKAVSEKGNSVLVQGIAGDSQIINLEYVTRLREYPRNKNGKKKTIVAD